ncbi:SIR2 family protein [Acinetobacter guillouiae]|uniref:SIR2 family protein n=1 Tax=Acinetobacter guillouiae TaxID=106649 RepID=UPI001CD1A7C7|nr:SIR2 family protein [Acinetobacter guillouiae]
MPTIKFKDLIEGELQNKVRKVKDLVDYVGKTAPSHPNYSIFLGAGASVASGIKTGGNLVNQWRKETYEKDGLDYYIDLESYSPEEREEKARERAIDYLIKKHGVWYNPQNEYSSLFERKFDLPVQRRRFVEDLVDGHLPSIGYLFLITLINNNFFNTIFTTNFDDLINEAFYQFSNTRPILCAHDSAVSSISVVAKRPKIIKLHGDYLFDDIKNTIKETESLEQNIKQKFIEFTKDNGLIVVGYSGQDRSILDVLNYLLQQEDYLKNGLYWCFRAEDEISHEVRKILWKDKVYCVQIDGFDELFSEFCNVANIKPSLVDNPFESKRESCINKFVQDYNDSKSKNKWISEFIDEISTTKSNQDLSELIRQLNENKSSNLSSEQLKSLLLIETLIKKGDTRYALELVDENILEETDEELLENYYILKIRILRILKKSDLALKLIDKLIEKDEFNIKHHIWRLMFLNSIKDKVSYLKHVNEKLEYSVSIKNSLISMFLNYHEEYEGELSISFEDCEALIEQSLVMDSSLDNDAYRYKFNFLKLKKNKELKGEKLNKRQEKEEKIDSEMEMFLEKVININKYSLESITLRLSYILYKKDMQVLKLFLNEINGFKNKMSKNNAKEITRIIAQVYNDLVTYSKDDLDGVVNYSNFNFNEIHDFFNNTEDDILKESNVDFLLECAKYNISKSNDFIGLSNNLDKILNIASSISFVRDICKRFSIVRSRDINEKLVLYVKSNKGRLSPSDYFYCLYEVENSNGNYSLSLDYLKKYFSVEQMEGSDYILYVYELLLNEDYTAVIDFVKESKSEINELSVQQKVILDINELTAKKHINSKLDQKEKTFLEGVISKHSDTKRILVCANSLLNKNSEALHHMKDMIKADYSVYYELTEWPAINSTLKEDIEKFFNSLVNNESKAYVA